MHKPVMVNEVVHHFSPKQNGIILDCTIGSGGHARALLEAYNGQCKIIGLDCDEEALVRAKENLSNFKKNIITLRHNNFVLLDTVLDEIHVDRIDACLFDLGVSTNQLMEQRRGFSFNDNGPLDMRMNQNSDQSAADIVNTASSDELYEIIRIFGEDRHAWRIARGIVHMRERKPITTTTELVTVINQVVPHRMFNRIHPATRTFQALRIAVNRELDNLKGALQKVLRYMADEGIICVIAFHSLEDRIVKNTFRVWAQNGLVTLLTKKPLQPAAHEVTENRYARSAKMRIAKRNLHV